MKIKLISLLLASGMAVALLTTGCTSKAVEPSTSAPQNSALKDKGTVHLSDFISAFFQYGLWLFQSGVPFDGSSSHYHIIFQ